MLFISIFTNANSYADNFNNRYFTSVKEYLYNLNSLEADFLQVSSNGDIKEGKIFLSLPGKLRISYNNPDNLLITSNGFWLTVQDKKLKQTNNFPLNQTPLNLFLNKELNFDEDEFKIKFEKRSGIISLTFSDIFQRLIISSVMRLNSI